MKLPLFLIRLISQLHRMRSTNPNMPQTAGYLVADDGTIKFPILGNLHAAGLTQKQLENTYYPTIGR